MSSVGRAARCELVEQVLVQLDAGAEGDVVDHPELGVEVEHRVDQVADVLLVRGGDAEQRRDHHRRQAGAELLHEVERLGPAPTVEQVAADAADAVLERADAAGGERRETSVAAGCAPAGP